MTTPPPTREERLERALRFYADENDWDEFYDDAMAAAFDRNGGSMLGSDRGRIARQALDADGEETKP